MNRLRALSAIRLSVRTDETTSPARQRAANTGEAARRGAVLIGEAEDPDVSATRTTPFDDPEAVAILSAVIRDVLDGGSLTAVAMALNDAEAPAPRDYQAIKVEKGHPGGGRERLLGPDLRRLAFEMRTSTAPAAATNAPPRAEPSTPQAT
ncbi:hypothetical protein [Nocardiopsis potens]|uniref:hypothetical protein n=1 Tax=Nocardiopsis potens TaxID=1246458 RepID=UPI001267C8A6|nr:hypothetical protein [Nocardiopsis potens]